MKYVHDRISRRTMLKWIAGASGLGAATFLASCAPAATPSAGTSVTTQRAGGSGRITLATVGDTPESTAFYKQQLEVFSKKSGIAVEMLAYPQSQ